MEQNHGDMYAYILESKDITHTILKQQDDIFKEVEQYCEKHCIEQIYLIGSGTSYHAALSAKTFLEKILEIKVFVNYPTVFMEDAIFNKHTLVMGISHAGKSASTISGLQRAHAMGLPTVALSAEKQTPIYEHADCALSIEIGEELAGPKTKGYIGSIVTLLVFGIRMAFKQKKIKKEKVEEYERRILQNVDTIPDIAAATCTWYEQHKKELKSCRRLYVIGYGQCLGSMMEGTLKILEAVRYSVQGYEMEEFMHGIYHAIDSETFLLYMGCNGPCYERILRLKRYFEKERTTHNFLLTSKDGGEKDFVFPFTNDDDFAGLQYVVPMQVLAKKLSLDLGIDCNIPSDPNFHKKMESYLYK